MYLSGIIGAVLALVAYETYNRQGQLLGYVEQYRSPLFEWENITPSKDLVFHPCFDVFQCARLAVPLDWNSTEEEDPRKVAIAIVKLPAIVPVTDPRYGGPVITNPGGPGVSGVDNMIKGGRYFQELLSADNPTPPKLAMNDTSSPDRYFDVIGFDPRSINNTTPRLSCFRSETDRHEWALKAIAEGIFASSSAAYDTLWARAHALWDACSNPDLIDVEAEDKAIARFMNTAPVARDVIEIVDRHAQWRGREAERIFSKNIDLASILVRDTVRERVCFKTGEEKLQYWGFSYGTVLGATLAASYPQRIGRAVLDAVADADDFVKGKWITNLQNTDQGLDWFSRDCYEAGEEKCPLYVPEGVDAVKTRYLQILVDLKENPLPVQNTSSGKPEIVTWSDVKRVVMNSQYWGLKQSKWLAQMLKDVEGNNGTLAADAKNAPGITRLFLSEASGGVLCADAEDLTSTTKEEFLLYWNSLREQSELIGELWGEISLRCTAWGFRPKWRYSGPFAAETAHPMLIIGNTVDNVTPLRNAQRLSKNYPGSVVLQHDAWGHCTYSHPSLCTGKHVRNYFQTGELPAPGTVCGVSRSAFDGFAEEEEPSLGASDEDLDLEKALVGLWRAWP